MLSVFNIEVHTHKPKSKLKHATNRYEETFEGNGYIYYLDRGEGNMSVYICSLPNFMH